MNSGPLKFPFLVRVGNWSECQLLGSLQRPTLRAHKENGTGGAGLDSRSHSLAPALGGDPAWEEMEMGLETG